MRNRLLLLGPLMLFLHCAVHTGLQPTGQGNLKSHLSMGGPIIKAFGTHVSVPYAVTGIRYGLRERLDISSNIHLFSLAYKIAGFDVATTYYPLSGKGMIPNLALQPRLMTLMSLKSDVEERMKFYPIISASGSWQFGSGLAYTGADLLIPVTRPDYDNESPHVILSPFVGYCWNLGKGIALYTELKWQGANLESHQLSVEYLPLGNQGAISTLVGIERGL